MPNTITDRGITFKSYNSRGLVTHRGVTHALVHASDGLLWAAIRDGHVGQYISIVKSDDNGFSWKEMYRGTFTATVRRVGISGLNQNGPFIDLALFEDINRLCMTHAYYDTGTSQYGAESWVFTYDEAADTLTRVTTDIAATNAFLFNQDFMALRMAYNEHAMYMVYTRFSDLKVSVYRPTYQTTAEVSGSSTGPYFNVFDANASANGYVDIAVIRDDGAAFKLQYIKFTHATASMAAPVTVFTQLAAADIACMNIVRDGNGNLLIAYGEENVAGSDIDVKYVISTDNGATWTSPTTINKSSGHAVYVDNITSQVDVRLQAVGGISGFMLAYTRSVSGVARTFVRQLITTNGSVYTLGDEEEIATQTTLSTENVVGARFFLPPGSRLLDLEDPGTVRVAYQIGQGNSSQQADTVPVRFGQELLRESAYPSTLASESGSYIPDTATDTQVLIEFAVLAGPNENDDYYDLGFTGTMTQRYIKAINKIGLSSRLLQYEPIQEAEMDDRSAFEAPIEHFKKIVISPQTYDLPLANKEDDFETFIERDIRKVHIPPDFHIDRTFLLNRGNFIKRTVWTVTFDGNEYEITQVVPHFINDQICYYSANAYVVGPSRDPFSRTILPSET